MHWLSILTAKTLRKLNTSSKASMTPAAKTTWPWYNMQEADQVVKQMHRGICLIADIEAHQHRPDSLWLTDTAAAPTALGSNTTSLFPSSAVWLGSPHNPNPSFPFTSPGPERVMWNLSVFDPTTFAFHWHFGRTWKNISWCLFPKNHKNRGNKHQPQINPLRLALEGS